MPELDAEARAQTFFRLSVFLRRLHRILFQCRYATLRLLLSTGRDSDDPPSCVVGLSQTRLSGDRQFHIFRNFQFQYLSFVFTVMET